MHTGPISLEGAKTIKAKQAWAMPEEGVVTKPAVKLERPRPEGMPMEAEDIGGERSASQ